MSSPEAPAPEPATLSPLLARHGAVAAEPPDAAVAAHYGDPMREQRRLEEDRVGFVDLSHRGVITISGPDRLTWLHALSTQAVESLAPGAGTSALLLSPHGHIEHALQLVDDGETTWAHVEPGTATGLTGFLDSMRFLMRVEVADRTAEYALVWEPAPDGPTPYLARSGADSLGGRELFVPRGDLESYADQAGPPAGCSALEALRIAARLPRFGRETDHRTLPNEVGWLDTAVHLDKGCYRGQEAVARVHNLGRPPRRLTFLHLDGSVDALPGHGAQVGDGKRSVGFVTSSARHADLGPIALALVRRNVPVGAALVVDAGAHADVDAGAHAEADAGAGAGTVAAAQETVVDPDVGLHVRPILG